MNILFVSSEIAPFAKTGGLGDVAEALPLALNSIGHNCSAIMPLYGLVAKNGFSPKKVKTSIPLKIGDKKTSFDLFLLEHRGTKFYFVRQDDLYKRDGLYGSPKGDHPDNAMRFGIFARAVLQSLSYIGDIDILHCNDWQSGLIPLHLKNAKTPKTLFTIHNMAYQGLFPKGALKELGLPDNSFTGDGLEFWGKVSFLKSGIVYSDAISTVSKGYAGEILTREFGCGMDHILEKRKKDLYGIVNGADYSTWNPETDKLIAKTYNLSNLAPKIECKKALLKELNIPFDHKKPLVGMITRLAHQKGLDIVADAMDDMLNLGINFVILGTGDENYNRMFAELYKRFKGKAAAKITFDNALAHRIEAGSDMFLMPSRYEPCGLNQMYSMKYATVPVVRGTGGLNDTITEFDPGTGKGNGFKFKKAHSEDMLNALKRAVKVFKNKKMWALLQANGLKCDFSWESSAQKYVKLYRKILK